MDTIPTCDGQQDGRTARRTSYDGKDRARQSVVQVKTAPLLCDLEWPLEVSFNYIPASYENCHSLLVWRTVPDPGGGAGGSRPLYRRVIFGSGDFLCINVYHILTVWGTVSTFVACCYKQDIYISRIVTQNILKCAISKAKFQNFLGRAQPFPRSSGEVIFNCTRWLWKTLQSPSLMNDAWLMFVYLFVWCLMALSAQIGYIMP